MKWFPGRVMAFLSTCLFAASLGLFIGAWRQVVTGQELQRQLANRGISSDEIPPTMLAEHSSAAFAMACLALLCLIFAVRFAREAVIDHIASNNQL